MINNLFNDYIKDADWKIKENANTQKSINGLNNYIREKFTEKYWRELYPADLFKYHDSGQIYIHDLGFLGNYCCGWDLQQMLMEGFKGAKSKHESKPAKHLRSFLGQVTNATFVLQAENAGAQAWSSFDTYCAGFVRSDNMSYEAVKQCLQEFVFNLNVPTRVGFQSPFSNLTFDVKIPTKFKNESVIVGGKSLNLKYGDLQNEVDIINKAFCEVMLEGDAKGRVFTFPIPTINVTKDFDWDNEVIDNWISITGKYGIPYFANYVKGDINPDDALSMCCRLRLDTDQIRQRGGLFNSNPLTGSIGVVTLNLPRIAYESKKNNTDFITDVKHYCEIAKKLLKIKRVIIEDLASKELYPYTTHYLRGVKDRFGEYFYNHFSTIGLIGMNEACLNVYGSDISNNKSMTIKLLNELRELVKEDMFNLEATPAEGCSYKLALKDKKDYPSLITSGTDDSPYYTNSTQLPADYSDNMLTVLEHQEEIQSLYTGGTVLHLYMTQGIKNNKSLKCLLKFITSNFKVPYVSITPTFSICKNHSYIVGEYSNCPHCGEPTEIWSRVTGYLRPVQSYNKGKKQEFIDRKKY